jgi:hypothetical protein
MLSKLISRLIMFGSVLALLTAGALTLSSKLPKPAAAQQAIDPAIVAGHLLTMRDQEALP